MDVYRELERGKRGRMDVIRTVDMHTSGEPTRIVVEGYPELMGKTLLEKRAYAREKLDFIRRRLMFEPRGHAGMYGAILVKETELTESGEADIGVLFCHNEGYSTMCGHATIALGRFLVDTQDRGVFPRRGQVRYEEEKKETVVRVHAPCGVVEVTVPTVEEGGRRRSDEGKRVRFTSVESFVGGLGVAVRTLGGRTARVDVGYGGAFYAIVDANELGLHGRLRECATLQAECAALKAALGSWDASARVEHPQHAELEYVYGIIVVDGELAVCVFADGQIDRSPCGSGVCARLAVAVARGSVAVGERRPFHSPVSAADPASVFLGRAWAAVRAEVEGRASYTGAHALVAEDSDRLPPFLVP
ncbi:hypothetical protein BKA93DRAFT_847474 [Sparassis latifolia]